jgi:hypothetical protein
LPVVLVLLAGLLLLTIATVTFRDPERHAVLIVAGASAVIVCGVSIVALAYLIQRPMVELQERSPRSAMATSMSRSASPSATMKSGTWAATSTP